MIAECSKHFMLPGLKRVSSSTNFTYGMGGDVIPEAKDASYSSQLTQHRYGQIRETHHTFLYAAFCADGC